MNLDPRWKNPQGAEPQQQYLWAQDLIKELRKGDYLDQARATELIGQYNSGFFAELVPTVPIATAAGAGLTPIYRLPILDVQPGDILFATSTAGLTSNQAYNYTINTTLVVSPNENLQSATQTLDLLHGTTFVDSAGAQHSGMIAAGAVEVVYSGFVYVGLLVEAHSSAAGVGDTLTVDSISGKLSVLHYRPNGPATPYIANAVNFDGTNDFLARGGGLASALDTKEITISAWVKKNSGDGVLQIVQGSDRVTLGGGAANAIRMFINTTNNFFIAGNDAAGAGILQINSTAGAMLVSSGWTHVMFSCDLSDVAKRHLYINDVSDLATVTTYTNAALDWTIADWSIGARPSGADKLNGDLADLWLANVYTDLSQVANRRLFITATKKPVNLGQNGMRQIGGTDRVPLLYLSGPTATWHKNRGLGGGLTVTGALTTATTSPTNS